MFRIAATISLAILFCVGCNQPPAGFYETIVHPNVEFIRRGEVKLEMDIVVPKGAPSPRPTVLLWHGGGWVVGARKYELELARFIASLGYTAATASYRLCTIREIHYPVPIQDAVAAVKFLRAKGADYGVDPQRIVVGGESAGGAIALMVALLKDHAVFRDDSYPGVPSDVTAAIAIYAPTDLQPLFEGGDWSVRIPGLAYVGCDPKDHPEKYREASPITYVRAEAPPILLLHGDADTMVPFDQAKRFHKAMQDVGGRSHLIRVSGAPHGWGLVFTSNYSMRTLPAIAHFLARLFPGDAIPPVATTTRNPL